VVVLRIVGAFLLIGAVAEFLLFVVRVPGQWVPGYSERLAERGPRLSKANMNRGDFTIYFIAWIFRSRIRAALFCILTGYMGWLLWAWQPSSG
jgi:hypothetical protein